MTRRERNIIYIAVAVAAILLLLRGLPVIASIHVERQASIETIRDDIAREEALIANQQEWQDRRESINERLASLEEQVFSGDTVPLLTANIQRMVRQYAQETGITIVSTRLAEPLETEGWLLVEQEMTFTMDNQSNTLGFLRRLEESRPWLGVSSFTMRRSRNQYTGTVTVVGFSRTSGPAAPPVAEPQAPVAHETLGAGR